MTDEQHLDYQLLSTSSSINRLILQRDIILVECVIPVHAEFSLRASKWGPLLVQLQLPAEQFWESQLNIWGKKAQVGQKRKTLYMYCEQISHMCKGLDECGKKKTERILLLVDLSLHPCCLCYTVSHNDSYTYFVTLANTLVQTQYKIKYVLTCNNSLTLSTWPLLLSSNTL